MSTAILTAHGVNLQIIACAGAGKTEAVSQRVVEQLQLPGVAPENVVAFTFNERAAAELKERIALRYEEAVSSREGLADLYVGTIHGFCLDLLQQHAFDALSYRVLNDVQQRLLISRNSNKSGLNDLGWHRYHDASTYAELMAILREGDIDFSALGGSTAEGCLEKYCQLLGEKRYLDFTAIVSEAVALLEDEEDDTFRSRVAGRIRYLTVDEYQDVNPIQERLTRALVALGANVTVVGDDDQLLYGWRGSSIGNILTFEKRYDHVSVTRLEKNYRSSRGIVDLAREVIANNDPDRLAKSMVSAGRQEYEEDDIQLKDFATPTEEATFIARETFRVIGTPFRDQPDREPRGITFSDIAILVRVKKLIPAIAAALESAEIPYVVGGVSTLFGAEEAQAARQLFYHLAGEVSLEDVGKAWRRARLGLSNKDIERGLEVARDNRDRIVSGTGRFGIYNLQRSFLDFLTAVELREEKIEGASRSHAHSRAEVVYYNLGKFSEVISDFEQINFQSAPAQKYESFAGFLRHQAEDIYPEGWLEARYVTPDAVQILTIHQAKGLQWPAVFVPGLTAGRFPPKGAGGRSPWSVIPAGTVRNQADYRGDVKDERRLFYVACTRAKKFLWLTRATYPTAKRAWATPSPFWIEAQDAISKIDPADAKPRRRKLKPAQEHGIANVNLSFSELKYAFECPYSFELRFLYGFNPPIAEALGYGKGLHDALYELHDRALNGGDTSEAVVGELVERHLFLPFAYPDLRRTLTDAAQRRLRAYIAARGADFKDIEHAERPIEIDLGDGIRVTGRIDLIRRKSTNEVVVIDFKSNDRTQQEEVTDLQLRVYALGYRQATGENADQVVVDNLDDLKHPKIQQVDQQMLDEAADAVRLAGTRMRRNDFPRQPSGNTLRKRDATCKRCDLAGICGTHTYV
jgi:DNA helicase II / ATP-dependent DNA helicase PcrA